MAQTSTETLPAEEITVMRESVRQFLLRRHFNEEEDGTLVGVNRETEFYMTVGEREISIHAIDRYTYEPYTDGIRYDNDTFHNLTTMIGR